MAALPQTLIEAVRRRLWLGQFLAAARLALWGTAGLMLLTAAVHLAGWPLSPDLMFLALAFVWSVMAARAAWQRPVDAACALWADRHLGGASAYTTLLELDSPGPGTPPSHAIRHLEAFARLRLGPGVAAIGVGALCVGSIEVVDQHSAQEVGVATGQPRYGAEEGWVDGATVI